MTGRLQMERLLKIERRIRGGGHPSRRDLAAELEVTERTVQRDLEFMTDRFGAPIEYSRRHGGYRFREPTWFLPAVPLTEGELFALLVARQAVAQYRGAPIAKTLETIFRKIAGALDETIHVSSDYSPGVLRFAPAPVLSVDETAWNRILQAARSFRRVRMTYRSRRSGTVSEREVDPYHVVNMQGDWYLFGHDRTRDRIGQFQLHRVVRVRVLEESFSVRRDYRLDSILHSSFGSFGSDRELTPVRLRITGEMAGLLEGRILHPRQTVRRVPGGWDLSFPVSAAGNRPFFHLVQWILGLGRDVRVLAPRRLKERVLEEIEAMRAVARGGGAPEPAPPPSKPASSSAAVGRPRKGAASP